MIGPPSISISSEIKPYTDGQMSLGGPAPNGGGHLLPPPPPYRPGSPSGSDLSSPYTSPAPSPGPSPLHSPLPSPGSSPCVSPLLLETPTPVSKLSYHGFAFICYLKSHFTNWQYVSSPIFDY